MLEKMSKFFSPDQSGSGSNMGGEKNEKENNEKPLGYIEGSGGALTPYYSEEERLRLLEEIRDNQD